MVNYGGLVTSTVIVEQGSKPEISSLCTGWFVETVKMMIIPNRSSSTTHYSNLSTGILMILNTAQSRSMIYSVRYLSLGEDASFQKTLPITSSINQAWVIRLGYCLQATQPGNDTCTTSIRSKGCFHKKTCLPIGTLDGQKELNIQMSSVCLGPLGWPTMTCLANLTNDQTQCPPFS